MLARVRIFPCSACEHRRKIHRRFSFYAKKAPASQVGRGSPAPNVGKSAAAQLVRTLCSARRRSCFEEFPIAQKKRAAPTEGLNMKITLDYVLPQPSQGLFLVDLDI